jgi:hypothetical protein
MKYRENIFLISFGGKSLLNFVILVIIGSHLSHKSTAQCEHKVQF